MYIPPKALSEKILSPEVLRPDRVCCTHYEDFGLGDKALYVGMYGINRIGYIPLSAITRVFKRLAVTKGFSRTENLRHPVLSGGMLRRQAESVALHP